MVSIVSQLHQTSRRFIWSSSGGASNKSPHHADCSDVTSYNWCNAAVIAHWTRLPLQYIYNLIIYRYTWSCCSMTHPALEWSKWAEWGSPPHQQPPSIPLFQLIYNCRVKEVQQTGDCLMKGTQVLVLLVPPRSTTTLYCIVSPI